jgi:NAD(P)-dependent dehydrogenase (short-subunit alcohol dehydrogenase family)
VTPGAGQRVVAVTGGGGGIGAAIAEELGRQGAFVVTIDPLVSLDGSEQLSAPEETTAGRIVAAGGAARATSVSVTDAGRVRDLFAELGRLDALVNVAGITRPTSFARGSDEDWRAVLDVHLQGYVNVLAAALPVMAAAGGGRILGVTSGSGWRPADAGAYSCAKRAVATLTWQLGRCAPPGVVVNAISPIAVTRMVTAALGRGASHGGGAATGGLSLGSMPAPEALGPFGAHLVSAGFDGCTGRVLFTAGSEVAVIDEPRLLEVVRTDGVPSVGRVLEAVGPAFVAAEASQAAGGAGNPRFDGAAFADPAHPPASSPVRRCAVVAEHSRATATITSALEARGVPCTVIAGGDIPAGVAGASAALADAATAGPIDAVVVARGRPSRAAGDPDGWARVLDEHEGLAAEIQGDAAWARAVADHAGATGRPVRLVTVTEATTSGGRTRAAAAAQLARAGLGATDGRVAAFAVSVEVPAGPGRHPVGDLVAHIVVHAEAPGLAGAELAVGPGWLGLRSHPRPGGSITLGGPDVPPWIDGALRRIVGEEER